MIGAQLFLSITNNFYGLLTVVTKGEDSLDLVRKEGILKELVVKNSFGLNYNELIQFKLNE